MVPRLPTQLLRSRLRRSRKLLVTNHVHDLAHLPPPEKLDGKACKAQGVLGLSIAAVGSSDVGLKVR